MNFLQLSPTIRTAKPDEVPRYKEFLDRIKESETAKIIEGFKFQYNETYALPFSFFAEINVDNSRLWSLFKKLVMQLPDEICLVYNYNDEEPSYSTYANKQMVLNRLEQYKLEITQDVFLEVGVVFSNETFFEEVVIRSPKYLQYWGIDEKSFRETMAEFKINEESQLNFIDQYPIVREPLKLHSPDVMETGEVLAQLAHIISIK